jgi:HPt (histidine-containing phosphotransfer) domain-containing protein
MLEEHDDLLEGFMEDALQHLQEMEPDLIALERSGKDTDPDVINRIFRAVHSIKGAAGFFGLENIGTLGHAMESLLAKVRDGELVPDPKMIDALLSGGDTLRALLEDIAASDQRDIGARIAALRAFGEDRPAAPAVAVEPADGADSFAISADDADRFLREGLHLYAIRIFLRKDIRDRGKSPYDFIRNMESMGHYVDAFLDTVGGDGPGRLPGQRSGLLLSFRDDSRTGLRARRPGTSGSAGARGDPPSRRKDPGRNPGRNLRGGIRISDSGESPEAEPAAAAETPDEAPAPRRRRPRKTRRPTRPILPRPGPKRRRQGGVPPPPRLAAGYPKTGNRTNRPDRPHRRDRTPRIPRRSGTSPSSPRTRSGWAWGSSTSW